MKKRAFIKNAAILTVTQFILRSIGIFFRVYISNVIGTEGMGLHQLIFSVYTFASAIASSGVSVAVTKLVSAQSGHLGKAGAREIMGKALFISLGLGVFSGALMFFSSDAAANYWLGDMRAAMSLKILSFGLPFMAVSASLKGYFLARRNAAVPSRSQIFEQLVRIAVVVSLLVPFSKKGLGWACAAVVLGNAVSEAGAFLWIWIGYLFDLKRLKDCKEKPKRCMREMISVFVPVALTAYVNTALHTAENLLVPGALKRYTKDSSLALSQFGILKGMTIPVLFFPSSFLSAVSALLVPEISEYDACGNKKSMRKTLSSVLHITFYSSILAAGGFFAFAYEIGQILYKNPEVGFYIKALAPIIPFMYAESITAGVLHGLNQQRAALRYNVYNSVVRISAIMLILPRYGICGFIGIMAASNIYTSVMCVRRLKIVSGIKFEWRKWIVSPVLAVLAAYGASGVFSMYFSCGSFMKTTVSAMIFLAVFMLFSLVLGAVDREDMNELFGRLKRGRRHA